MREATSNDPWGPSSSLMSEIAELTNNPLAYNEVMAMIWRRMNDHGKNWRHVYKSLVLLEYLMKHGSERVARECRANIVAVRTLADFQHVDENGRDNGLAVREKARQLAILLGDDERLRNERIRAHDAQERFGGSSPSGRNDRDSPTVNVTRLDKYSAPSSSSQQQQVSRPSTNNTEIDTVRPTTTGEEELQLQLALALSKEEHDEELKRQKADELKLQMAIEESKKTARGGSEASRSQRSKSRSSADASQFVPPVKSNPPAVSLLDGPLDSILRDPWAGTVSAPQPLPQAKSSTPRRDPWADLVDAPAVVPKTSSSNDPWSALRSSSPVPVIYSDIQREMAPTLAPWEEVEAKMAANNGMFASDQTGAKSKLRGPPALYDDEHEFAALSLRSKSDAPSGSNTKNGTSANIDLFDLGSEPLAPFSSLDILKPEPVRKMTPEEFLGPNAKLVDFEDLVSKPTPQSNVNPFALTIGKQAVANPFATKAKEEEMNRRVPINQIPSATGLPLSSSGSTLAPSTVYPSLAVVYSPQTMPVPPQQQGYNPFL